MSRLADPTHDVPDRRTDRPSSANYHANALARGLSLLEQLASRSHPMALSEFFESTSVPKSTLVRLLSVLSEMDYVVRVDNRPSYRLGHRVQILGSAYASTLDLSEVASRHLDPLAREIRQTANLGVLDGDQVVHVCVSEPDRPLRFTTVAGARDFTYCTGLGKVLLSMIDPESIPQRVPSEPFDAVTAHSITKLAPLRTEIAKVTRKGFAVDDNERSMGLRCVAVPVPGTERNPAAISVSGPSAEFAPARQDRYATELRQVAERMAHDGDFQAGLGILYRSLRGTPQEFTPPH